MTPWPRSRSSESDGLDLEKRHGAHTCLYIAFLLPLILDDQLRPLAREQKPDTFDGRMRTRMLGRQRITKIVGTTCLRDADVFRQGCGGVQSSEVLIEIKPLREVKKTRSSGFGVRIHYG